MIPVVSVRTGLQTNPMAKKSVYISRKFVIKYAVKPCPEVKLVVFIA
jgi:hypothetical protein